MAPPHAPFRDAAPRDGMVHLHPLSGARCVPGHCLGAIAAGPAFRAERRKALDTLQIGAPRPAQAARARAIEQVPARLPAA